MNEAKNVKNLFPSEVENIILELPRAMFDEKQIAYQVKSAFGFGFKSYMINNIAGISIVKENAAGSEITGGFGLNILNKVSLNEYLKLGVNNALFSVEIPLRAANNISNNLRPKDFALYNNVNGSCGFTEPADESDNIINETATSTFCGVGIIGYGHIPLMLTRACPIRPYISCKACGGLSHLKDRKGKNIRILCHGGTRELLNPVPIWLGDIKYKIHTDFEMLYFTTETPKETDEIVKKYNTGAAFGSEFTRGLYLR